MNWEFFPQVDGNRVCKQFFQFLRLSVIFCLLSKRHLHAQLFCSRPVFPVKTLKHFGKIIKFDFAAGRCEHMILQQRSLGFFCTGNLFTFCSSFFLQKWLAGVERPPCFRWYHLPVITINGVWHKGNSKFASTVIKNCWHCRFVEHYSTAVIYTT